MVHARLRPLATPLLMLGMPPFGCTTTATDKRGCTVAITNYKHPLLIAIGVGLVVLTLAVAFGVAYGSNGDRGAPVTKSPGVANGSNASGLSAASDMSTGSDGDGGVLILDTPESTSGATTRRATAAPSAQPDAKATQTQHPPLAPPTSTSTTTTTWVFNCCCYLLPVACVCGDDVCQTLG